MYYSKITLRVRYGETDQMGCVYYGNYALYYEQARVEAIRQLGLAYKDLEAAGVYIPVTEYTSRYLRPARYDDMLIIHTTVRSLESRAITFHSVIHNEAGKRLNEGHVTLVFYDPDTRRRISMPDILSAKLGPYFQPCDAHT